MADCDIKTYPSFGLMVIQCKTARPVAFGANWVEDWAPLGRCAKSDPDALFVQGAAQQTAKIVELVRSGDVPRDSTVLYAHLGGQQAVNAYHSLWSS